MEKIHKPKDISGYRSDIEYRFGNQSVISLSRKIRNFNDTIVLDDNVSDNLYENHLVDTKNGTKISLLTDSIRISIPVAGDEDIDAASIQAENRQFNRYKNLVKELD